jgi:phage terminase large subunit-like protein
MTSLSRQKIYSLFPDEGLLRRELYPKHAEFFSAGTTYQERAFIAANRIGKTTAAAYETTCHLLGWYPDWWIGRRFPHPVVSWACGEDAKAMRESIQPIMLGFPLGEMGTGMIPAESILGTPTKRAGVPESIDSMNIQHSSGGVSRLTFKTYDQGRESYQGAHVDVVWDDEEPPMGIYTEGLTRTMSVVPGQPNGLVICTFTPLKGLSAVVQMFLKGGKVEVHEGTRFSLMATWDDVPHLDAEAKAGLISAYPPHERDARSKGVPALGAGAIWPVPEEDILVRPFEIPSWYRMAYALDVGWRRTACIWGALNPETDVLYLYHEYYRGEAEPPIHAEAIKAPGKWIPGVIDPAARGRSQDDGSRLLTQYQGLGLSLSPANNAVESGLYDVWMRLSSGRLKTFNHLQNWLTEFRIYRRDEKGKVVKENDHLMDATRYLIVSGVHVAKQKPYEAWSEAKAKTRHQYDYEPFKDAYKPESVTLQ